MPEPKNRRTREDDAAPHATGVSGQPEIRHGLRRVIAVCAFASCASPLAAQDITSLEERLRKLEERQATYERMLEAKDARIRELEAERGGTSRSDSARTAAAQTPAPPQIEPAAQESDQPFGLFTPGRGFTVARTSWGELQLSVYSYLRYLNQDGLDDSYVDHFGATREIDIRDDFEINKIFLYTQGWFLDPKFKYTFYVWSAGPALGSANSILAAGNLTYTFNDAVTIGGGVLALPSTRSMDGQFPWWDRVDARLIADEFMRGSFTQGIWVNGKITDTLNYKIGLGNNLNAFGVSAARLDDRMNTIAAALTWMPATGEFGPRAGFGDFEHHDKLATLFSIHVTSSTEDRENQPGLTSPENTQIRLSNGTTVFTPDALAPGVSVDKLDYRMLAMSAGMKYRGFYLEAEAYRRWLRDFRTTGVLQIDELTDDGVQLQGSAMLLPTTLQVYAGASKIWGEYGNPWDVALGINWWPWKKRGFRVNAEMLHLENSPVGSNFLPYPVGATGWVFATSAELSF